MDWCGPIHNGWASYTMGMWVRVGIKWPWWFFMPIEASVQNVVFSLQYKWVVRWQQVWWVSSCDDMKFFWGSVQSRIRLYG